MFLRKFWKLSQIVFEEKFPTRSIVDRSKTIWNYFRVVFFTATELEQNGIL